MTKKIIAGNWKMNPVSSKEAKQIFSAIKRTAANLRKAKVIIFPPAVYLSELKSPGKSKTGLGAQDVFWENEGAFTGSLSALMVKNAGAISTLVGHSERRAAGETSEIINKKLQAALKNGLDVILCVGEKHRDEHGDYLAELQDQMEKDLAGFPVKYADHLMIAYEPVWAIGKNATGVETPEGFQRNAIFIKKVLSEIIGKKKAMEIPVLYGGSVSAKNAESFLVEGRADGLLVGRESLSPTGFGDILKIAEKSYK